MIKIEKNIPVSERGKWKFTRDMKTNESFLFSRDDRATLSSIAAAYKSRIPGFNYAIRKEGDQYRFFRIKSNPKD